MDMSEKDKKTLNRTLDLMIIKCWPSCAPVENMPALFFEAHPSPNISPPLGDQNGDKIPRFMPACDVIYAPLGVWLGPRASHF